MTIASELQDLATNLQAAKDAVEDKGGTVGDTGLAGLATEIASIPSGGGVVRPTTWAEFAAMTSADMQKCYDALIRFSSFSPENRSFPLLSK